VITSAYFNALKYHAAREYTEGDDIERIIGFDSEAYTTGEPFLFCFSDGFNCKPGFLVPVLFRRYNQCHLGVWNLKYDSGAVLYHLPEGKVELTEDVVLVDGVKGYYDDKGEFYPLDEDAFDIEPGRKELWLKNYTTVDGVRYEYIPHKHLKISSGKDTWVKFWDICQFYASSLDSAAKKYLGEAKMEIATKQFTPAYVKKHCGDIIKYCVRDADLTARLGNHLLDKCASFGIRATALYSTASLAFRYFSDKQVYIHIKRYWKNYQECLKYAMDSYSGGKFEATARGAFQGYEYDIISAYPFEMANLVNLQFADVRKSRKYEKDAMYGFIRCQLEVYEDTAVPCGLLIDNTRVYPVGRYYITLTKKEYDYLVSVGVGVKIISAWWLFIDRISYPYRDTVNELYALKRKFKKDTMEYSLVKICLNGYYGKMVQAIEDWKGQYQAGVAFNPFYASVITANTRIRVTEIQNTMRDDCIAVHTDSVMTLKPIPAKYLGDNLGDFELVEQGRGVLIACGCYQLGKAGAFKGFEPAKKPDGEYETWYDILTKYKRKHKIPYETLRVESWVEATAKGHTGTINLFQNMPKDIDVNADVKRIWSKNNMTAGDYLKHLYRSEPRVVVHTKKPELWKGK
jgi:DNA polymerase type B, organellar and viral